MATFLSLRRGRSPRRGGNLSHSHNQTHARSITISDDEPLPFYRAALIPISCGFHLSELDHCPNKWHLRLLRPLRGLALTNDDVVFLSSRRSVQRGGGNPTIIFNWILTNPVLLTFENTKGMMPGIIYHISTTQSPPIDKFINQPPLRLLQPLRGPQLLKANAR